MVSFSSQPHGAFDFGLFFGLRGAWGHEIAMGILLCLQKGENAQFPFLSGDLFCFFPKFLALHLGLHNIGKVP